MKNSNFISEKVYETNLNYVRLQNQTKELFIKCLDEGKDIDYFKTKLGEIWDNVDYSYLTEQIEEYEALMHEINTGKKVDDIKKLSIKEILPLVAISVIVKTNKKFQEMKEKEYIKSINSYGYKNDKKEYLKMKVKRYDNQSVPYYSASGELVRYVQPSTYNSMIHNTNLTRAGWNTTLSDGYQNQMYYIPSHSFSCPECIEHQNRPMTYKEVMRIIGDVDEGDTELLHPNCKCVLAFYEGGRLPTLDKGQAEEEYHIRQKTNTLTLRKEEILNDMKIQKDLGNQDEVDKLNKVRNRINEQIRELKEALPTAELKKQVVAINR